MVRALFIIGSAWAAYSTALVFFVYSGQRVHRVETASMAFVVAAAAYLVRGNSPAAPGPLPSQERSAGLLLLVTGALAAWLFALTKLLAFPFLSDDYVFLETIDTHRWSWEFYRPLFTLAFAALRSLGTVSALPFHAAAFALHVGCAALAGVLVKRLFNDWQAATLVGALVLMNPLQLESVLWVSGLQELLWAFFALMAVAIYSARFFLGLGQVVLTALAVAGAVASKETGVCVVLLLAGTDLVLGRRHQRYQYATYVVTVGCVVAYGLLRARAGVGGPGESFFVSSGYELKEFLVMPYRRFMFPWSAAVWNVPNGIAGLASLAMIGGVAWAVWTRRARMLVAGAAVILVATLPLQRYLYVSPILEHARYLYFPAVGWSMIIAGVVGATFRSRKGHLVASIVLIGVSGWSLLVNLRPWEETASFVRTLTERVEQGADPIVVLDEWRRSHGWPSDQGLALPASHDGVWLFQNGQEEFLRMARSGRLTAP